MQTSRLFAAIAVAATCLTAPAAFAAPAKAPITHEALWMMKRVGSPVVSPDGRWVLFQVTEPAYQADKAVSDLWLVPTDGSAPARRLTTAKGSEGGAVFSPDSARIAFTAKRDGDEAAQVYILDLASGGEARRVTSLSTGASAPQWRPDGQAILFESAVYPGALDDEANRKIAAERKEQKFNLRAYEHFPVRFWNEWLDDKRPAILVQSLAPGAVAKDILTPTALARTPGFSGVQDDSGVSLSPVWSPDGKEIVFVATTERWSAAYANVGYSIYRMPAEGGEPAVVTRDKADYADLTFAPDGKALYFTMAAQNAEEFNLSRLARLDWPKPGAVSLVARDFDRDVAAFALTPDSRTLYLLAPEAGGENLYKVAAAGGAPALAVAPAVGGYTSLAIPEKAKSPVLIATYGSAVNPAEVVRIDPVAKRHRNLTEVSTAAAAAIDWSPPQHFWMTTKSGRRVHSMIVTPPGFDPKKKYPLFVMIHGGPHSTNPDQIGLRWNYHLLAAPGYVVLMTDYMGSTGYGEAFARAIKLDPLKGPGEEIEAAVDEALKLYPFIDSSRMCAGGASYGGHLSNWLEATSTRYRCLISHAGEVDLFTQWGTSDAIYHREVGNGGPPWENNPIWRDQSPATYAANWKTPMLLSIGEKDYRVPLGNTLEAWSILQRQKVPSRLLVWPDAWHWITKPEDSRRFYAEVHHWLGKHLKDETGPAPTPAP